MSSYTNIFGGAVVQTANPSFLNVTPFTASITLSWPSQFQDVEDVVAAIMNVNPTVGGLTITMPDATQASVGQQVLFNNYGSHPVAILNHGGGTITTINAANIFFIYLIDNTTTNGTWTVTPWASGGGGVVTSVAAVSTTTPALTITGSPITGSGTFDFTLDTDLVALDSFAGGTGFAVRTGVGTWALRDLIPGTGINITNATGVAGNPQISVGSSLNLASLTVGNLNLTGNTISSTSGGINIFPLGGQSLNLGSNVMPIVINLNNDITNANVISAEEFDTTNLSISGSFISSLGDIGILPGSTSKVHLGSNINQVTIDQNNNIANVHDLTSSGTITAGTVTAATVTATTALTTTFSPSPIARAWITYNGIGHTVLSSFNVSSVTPLSTGVYRVNLTSSAPGPSYCVVATTITGGSPTPNIVGLTSLTSTFFTINVSNAGVGVDQTVTAVAFW